MSKFTSKDQNVYNYRIPIHFRYPRPAELNYTLVPLHPVDEVVLVCHRDDGNERVLVERVVIEEEMFSNRGVASVITGDSSDGRIVTVVTSILMIAAAMIFVKQLKKPL